MTDLLLSEVHVGRCPAGVGYWKSRFRLLNNHRVDLDEDGDLCLDELFWIIKHQRETPLDQVGTQIWRGGCLMVDFIFANQDLFCKKTVIELGSGVGIVGLALGNLAQEVFLTDHDVSALELCRENLKRNLESSKTVFHIRKLDWTVELNFLEPLEVNGESIEWKESDKSNLQLVDLFLAADVVYDDVLTNAFFAKLEMLMKSSRKLPVCFIAIEKRWNFTLNDLEVRASAYDHFRTFFDDGQIQNSSNHFFGEKLSITDLPKTLDVERNADQELWKLTLKNPLL